MRSDDILTTEAPDLWWRDLAPRQALGWSPVRAHLSGQGEVSLNELREAWGRESLLVANAPLLRTRLFGNRNFREAQHFDVLELFAFVPPALCC